MACMQMAMWLLYVQRVCLRVCVCFMHAMLVFVIICCSRVVCDMLSHTKDSTQQIENLLSEFTYTMTDHY